MATVEDLFFALKAADAAGNTEDAQKLASVLSSMGYGGQRKEAPPPENKSGFFPSLTSGFRAGAGSTAEALGELTGIEGLSKLGKEQVEKSVGMFTPTTEADVEAAKAKGILPAAGAYASKYVTEPLGEAVGSIAGRYGAPMAVAGAGLVFPEVALPLAAAGFATNASIHTGENLMRQKEVGKQPDYLSATTFGIGQAAIDQFSGHLLTGPMKSIIGRTATEEARLLAPRVLKGEMTADEAALMVGGKLRNVVQATAQNAAVGAGMMTGDEALRRASAGQEVTSPEALETYKQQAITAAELAPFFGLAHGLGQPGKARTMLGEAEKMRPRPPVVTEAPPPPALTPVNPAGTAADRLREMPGFAGVTNPNEAFLAQAREQQAAAQAQAEQVRQTQIKTASETKYSSDPAIDEMIRKRELAALGVMPEVQEPAPPLKMITPQDRAMERARNMPGFTGEETGINELLVNRPKEVAAENLKAEQEAKQNKVEEILGTTYSRDPLQNELARQREMEKLGFMPGVPIEAQLGMYPEGKERAPKKGEAKANEPLPGQLELKEEAPLEAAPEVKRSELEQLQAQHADLTQKMEALRIARTGKPPTPLSKSGKEYANLAAQRDEIASQMAEMSVREEPTYQEATPTKGEPALLSPDEIAEKAEYDARLKDLKENLKEIKAQTNAVKKEGYSLFQALRGTLNPKNISDISSDKEYKQLQAGKGKRGAMLEDVVADGILDDFLPPDMRTNNPNFMDIETDAVEHIREKLRTKNYLTHDTDIALKQLGYAAEEVEEQIKKHLTLKDINGLLEEAANEQRAIDQAAEKTTPESENRAAAPSEAAPTEEFNLRAETPEEIRAKQAETEARAAEEARIAREAEAKAEADAGVGEFKLTGSNREADIAAANGQRDIFSGPPDNTGEPIESKAKPTVSDLPKIEPPEGFKAKEGRKTEVVMAARELAAGRITKEQYDRYVDEYMPINTILGDTLEGPLKPDQLKTVLKLPKVGKADSKIDAPIADGTRVGLRMDIPALTEARKLGMNGSVVSIHKGSKPENVSEGENLSYKSAGAIKDVVFAPRKEEDSFKIAQQAEPEKYIARNGEEKLRQVADKKPQQTMEGTWVNRTPEDIFKQVKDILAGKTPDANQWVQVSLDPLRHSYFYDRANKRPVLSASEVLQVGRFVLAKDVKYGNREEFLYMKDVATPEQRKQAGYAAKETNGDIVYQNGDIGLIRAYAKDTGNAVLIGFKDGSYTHVNINEFTGRMFTPAEKLELMKARDQYLKSGEKELAKKPFIKFDKDGLAFSQSVPKDLAGVLGGWKKMLKIDANIYLTTTEDANTNRNFFKGAHEPIGASGNVPDIAGVMRKLDNGDYFIAFKPKENKQTMLEVLAHELGHVHEKEVFVKQDQATKDAIKAEYDKWFKANKGMSAREFIDNMRPRNIAEGTEVPDMPAARIPNFNSYWTKFNEWYADQTAKWATTQEKPLTVVEKFFSKLGASMKAFYAKLKGSKYLPNETFRDYLDRVSDSAFEAVKDINQQKDMVSNQMELEFMKDSIRSRAQEFLQKRAPMNKDAFSHIDSDTLDEVNRHFFAQNKTVIDRLDSLKGRMWQYVAQKVADEFRTIKEYTKVGHMMATQSKDINGALEGALFHGHVTLTDGALDILAGPDKKGLIESLKPLGKELDSYHVWKVLNRESRLPESQRSHDLDALVAKKDDFIKGDINGESRKRVYENVLKDEIALNRSVLGVALRTGLIDRFAYNRFSKDEFYIPFYRMLEDGSIQSLNQAARLTSKEFSKMLKGNNSKPFGDLMENTLRNWSHILSASMKNQAANVTIEAAREQGGAVPSLKPGFAWETDANGKNGRVVSAKTGKIVGNGELVQERKNEAGETEFVSMTERPEKGGTDVVKTQVDGVTTYHKILDPLLYESIGAVSAGSPKGLAIDVMRPFKEILRFGVTVSPTFKVANFIKDSIQAPAVSELSPNIIKNMYNGLYDARKGSPIYQSALAGGGIFNYGSALEGDRSAATRKLIAKGVDQATILDTPDKIKNFFSSTWHKYEELGNISEAANRVALYKQLRDSGYSHLEASFHARDLMNFSATGSSNAIRFISATVPFFNARIQGLYKLGRDGILPTSRVAYNTLTGKEMWNDPQNKLSDIQKAKSFATISGAACLASIALYMANKDDKDFQKREQWDRDFFFWSKVPGTDYAIRIPKPFEIGALATLAERTVEQMVDSGVEGKRFGESLSRMVWQTFSMNPVPQAFKPLVDIYANKNYFTNAPIETAGMERLSKQERITDKTSPLAKALGGVSHAMAPLTGEMGELSPVQVDYLIRAYMGWLGGAVAATSVEAVKPFNNGVYPSTDWTKPLTAGILEKEPSAQSAYLTDFYQNNQAIQQAYADMRHYAQLGQSEKVMEILADKKDEIGLAKFYDAQSKQLANIRKQLLMISSPSYTGMTSDQKEEEILRLKQLMSQVAEQAETARKSIKVNP